MEEKLLSTMGGKILKNCSYCCVRAVFVNIPINLVYLKHFLILFVKVVVCIPFCIYFRNDRCIDVDALKNTDTVAGSVAEPFLVGCKKLKLRM